MTQIIAVTQADIDAARDSGKWPEPRLAARCPISCALLRLYPAARGAYVRRDECGTHTNGRLLFRGDTNGPMRRFMRRWDGRGAAVPTRFRVVVTCSLLIEKERLT